MENLLNEIGFTSIFDDDVDDADFLSEVPVSLIESSLEEQFLEPLEYRKKDYIKEYFAKYEDIKQNSVLEDEYQTADEEHDEFISYVKELFEKFLDISFVNLDDKSIEDQHEIIHNTYKYFIKNIKKNFVNLVCKELKENKSVYIEKVVDSAKRDVTYLTFKEEIGNEEDAVIISNLSTIVAAIIDEVKSEFTVEHFFEMSDYGEADFIRSYVIDAYNNFDLTGNFVPMYCDMIDTDFLNEIESKVRNFILKQYPMRKKKEEIAQQTEEKIEDVVNDSEKINEENNSETKS